MRSPHDSPLSKFMHGGQKPSPQPKETPKGREFETPLTFKAEIDGVGIAIQTLKFYRGKRRFKDAKGYAKKWLKRKSPNGDFLSTLATVYLDEFEAAFFKGEDDPKDLVKAEEIILQAITMIPNDPHARDIFDQIQAAKKKSR